MGLTPTKGAMPPTTALRSPLHGKRPSDILKLCPTFAGASALRSQSTGSFPFRLTLLLTRRAGLTELASVQSHEEREWEWSKTKGALMAKAAAQQRITPFI